MFFTTKHHRKVIYRKFRRDIEVYLRRLCDYKGVEIVEVNVCSDHIHMLVKISPKITVFFLWNIKKVRVV